MQCPKCGDENDDSAKFCKSCGQDFANASKPKNRTNTIIIIVLAIICIGLLCAIISIATQPDIPLEPQDFEILKMSVPVGSDWQVSQSVPSVGNVGGLVYLSNEGEYAHEVSSFGVSTGIGSSIPPQVVYDKEIDGVTIFKGKNGEDLLVAAKEVGDYKLTLMGRDANLMAKMLNSVELTDIDVDDSEQQTSSTPVSSPSTPSSISILGGSFSTGSADADKTYARINVGTAHAGENVIVQIFYSRDGNSLNNGNMVPATVHSDGYLEIASADAYKYYPDYATINIYDSNSNLLTTQSVSLSPTSGTQTF